MLRFAHTYFLWALLLVPLFVVLFMLVRRWKKKALAAFGDRAVIGRIMPEVSFSRPTLKFIFFIVAYALLIIGLADPQIGTRTEEKRARVPIL